MGMTITRRVSLRNTPGLVDIYHRTSNLWNQLPTTWQLEFDQMRDEMQTLLCRIANHFDYFGNPAGWVPMLSFEANKLAFESEIDKAIRVLYLSYWINNAATTIQARVAAMGDAREKAKDGNHSLRDQL